MAEAVGGPEWPFHKPGEVLPLPNFSETVLEPERVGGGGGGGRPASSQELWRKRAGPFGRPPHEEQAKVVKTYS